MIKNVAVVSLILACSCWAPPVNGENLPIPDSPTLKEVALFPRDFNNQTLTIHFATLSRIRKSHLSELGKPFYEITVKSQDGTHSYEHNFPVLLSPKLARALLHSPLASNGVILGHITFTLIPIIKPYDDKAPLGQVLDLLLTENFAAAIQSIQVVSEDGEALELFQDINEEPKAPAESSPKKSDSSSSASLPLNRKVGIKNTSPFRYPIEARKFLQEGTVVIRCTVTTEGRPGIVEVKKSSGYKLLDQAAKHAVEQWTFIPARRNGETIQAVVDIPIGFDLDTE